MKPGETGILWGAFSALLALSLYAITAQADPVSGTLFYTTFAGGTNVHKVDFDYNGTTFTLSNNVGVATTSGADGLLFAPNGNLLVAGQGFNLTEITPAGAFVSAVNPGNPSFHLALSSNAPNALVYNMWNGGGNTPISAVTLAAGGLAGNGVAYTVSGTNTNSLDVRGVIFDPVNNTWYYGTAPDGGSGTFGTVAFNDTLHTATLTQLLIGTTTFAHGLSFDPFTNDIILNSADTIQQFDPTSGTIVSSMTGPGPFDQAAVDGNGHLFVASNNGFLEFVDYDATGLIGGAGNFTASPFLASALDDIAPLSGAGSRQVPEPSSLPLLLASGLTMLVFRRRPQGSWISKLVH
jgi:hypothetical protein